MDEKESGYPRSYEDLFEIMKIKEQKNVAYIASISHQLRTPLNAIIGFAQFLKEEIEEVRPDLVGDATKIEMAGHHLLDLANDILESVRLESSYLRIFVEEISIDKVLDQATALVGHHKTIPVKKEIHLDVGTIFSDLTRVRQVLANLLNNAHTFTEKGEIILKASPATYDGIPCIDITVKDTGKGIAPKDLENIFNRFYQIRETFEVSTGIGLGLFIAKQLTEKLGGRLSVKSELNKGSEFTLSLPVGDRTGTPKKRKSYVLIVDDDLDIREHLSQLLNEFGYPNRTSRDGFDAFDMLKRERFDAVLIDLNMPHVGGLELFGKLESFTEIPTIFMTGLVRGPITKKAQELNKNLLFKPFDVTDVVKMLESLGVYGDGQHCLEDDKA